MSSYGQARIIQSTETQSFNKETGEVETHEKVRTLSYPKEPPFIKLYLEDIGKIYDLPNNSSAVLFELLKQLNYNGLIPLNSSTKKEICKIVDYKPASLDNYLNKLCKKGIFIREDRGVYRPDPHLFGRGEWKDVYKMRQGWLSVSYDENGRSVNSSLNTDENN